MEVRYIEQKETKLLLSLNEDHFNDIKSKRIKPSKLQQTFVAFANSDGGDLYVGIEDKKELGERIFGFKEQEEANALISTLLEETTPSVENVLIEFLAIEAKGLVLHLGIPKSPKVHYTATEDCYVRINASTKKIKGEKITQLSYSKGAEPYERRGLDSIDIEDLIEGKLLPEYMERVNSHIEPESFLRKQRLLTRKDGERVPNVGAVLLFDDEPQANLETRCAVKVYRLRTNDTEYKREQLEEMPVTINGGIEDVINKTIKQVSKYIDGASFKDEERVVKLNYPSEALKEILVNAVIHRDYSLNDDIHVRVYNNRVEIQSPGKLPGYMTLENLYDERFSRNPNVVRMLHNLPNPINHDIGEGLDTAKNELKKAGLIDPIFSEKGNAFIVTIKHKKLKSIEDVVIQYFSEHPDSSIGNKLVRQLSGEDNMQRVKVALQKLRETGVIKVQDEKASAFNYRYIKV